MKMDDFVYKEIYELAFIHDLNFSDIYHEYINSALNIYDLKKIKNVQIRGIVYECHTILSEHLFESNLINEIFDVVNHIHDNKEKNYLVEKKILIKIRELCKCIDNDDWVFIKYKISFIISRRLFFVFNSNIEYEQNGEIELSILLQQIVTDLMSYLNMLKIYHRKNIFFNENHLKSLIIRILKKYSDVNDNVTFKLKRIAGKTIYFVKSNYNSNQYLHFYARVFLSPCVILIWKNLALNGGYHYLNKRRIIEPNQYNNDTIIIPDILNFVKNQNDIGFIIDTEMVEAQRNNVMDQIKKDNEINKNWGEYFSQISDLSDNELIDLINLESYKKKIKKNIYLKEIDNNEQLNIINEKIIKEEQKEKKNDGKLKKMYQKKNFLVNLIEKNIIKWNPTIYNKWIQKDFSHVFLLKIYLEYINFFIDYNDALYFTLYFDFRGRNYLSSMVSPTQGWPFRFLYYFNKPIVDDYTESLINIDLYENEIKEIECVIGKLTPNKKKNLLWILISIGGLTIQKKERISDSEFIREGLKNYINRTNLSDKSENSEIIYYYMIIDNLNKENELNKNRYILKDISGSIFQNASIILGIKNEDVLKYLNLNSDDWYDPYYPLITEISKHIKSNLLEFFSRKTLKKSIMTKYYNARLLTSFDYFIREVRKMDSYNENLFLDIWFEYKKVYEILKNLEKKLIFNNSNEDFNKFLKENKIVNIKYENFEFNIISFKLIPHRVDLVVNGKRISITTYKQSKSIFKQKTNNSMIPNIFHGEDSHRLRCLIANFDGQCFTIHDAFGIPYTKINKLIIIANQTFDINKKREFYMNNNNIITKLFSKYIIL